MLDFIFLLHGNTDGLIPFFFAHPEFGRLIKMGQLKWGKGSLLEAESDSG